MPEAVEGDPMSDARCDSCGGPARVWFAPSALWNLVMGGPDAKGDPGGMLCPNCFVDRAEAVWRKPTAWKIAPETDDDTENAKTISALRAALSRAEAEREEADRRVDKLGEDATTFVEFVLRHTTPARAASRTHAENFSIILHHPFAGEHAAGLSRTSHMEET